MSFSLVGLLSYVALILWIPSAIGGLIDPRFPDYIVDPLVPCPSYDYFEHPRNCSWFYRCHGSEHLPGFYRRDYFECAPGTAFSNEAKICDFQSFELCSNKCSACNLINAGSCAAYDVCPDPSNKDNNVTLELCQNPKFGCEACSTLSPCGQGKWMLSSNLLRQQNRLLLRQPSDIIKCYPSPDSPEMACSKSKETTAAPIPTHPSPIETDTSSFPTEVSSSETETSTAPTTVIPCTDCSISTSRCQRSEVCPDGVTPTNLTLCLLAKNDCQPCESSENVCTDGEQYAMEDGKCYPNTYLMICPCNQCSIVTENCITKNVCPTKTNPGIDLTLCPIARSYCLPCGNATDLCPDGQWYEVKDQKCYPDPVLMECPCDECSIVTDNCSTQSVCPTGNNPGVDLNLCSVAGNYCLPCGNTTSICPPGQFYDTAGKECYPDPDLMACPCDQCSIITNHCSTHDVCPTGKNPGINLNLCSVAENHCLPCGNTTNLCPDGQFYDTAGQKCYPDPELMVCPCDECSIVTDNCSTQSVCPTGNNPGIDLNLCPVAGNYCLPCGNTINLCPVGQFYDTMGQKCYQDPALMGCPCDQCSVVTSNCSVQINVCPTGQNPGMDLNLCSTAENYCLPCKNASNLCPDGQFYDTDGQNCYPDPANMTCPCDDCYISTVHCSRLEVCPDGKTHVNLTFCSRAERTCDPCGEKQLACPAGQHYAMEDGKCYRNPANMTCPTPQSCNDCYISTSRCQAAVVCPNGEPKTTLTLCPIASRVCDPCGSQVNVCPGGQHYSMEKASCFPPAASATMKCNPATNIKRITPVISAHTEDVNQYPVLECSERNLLPRDQWIKEKFCKNYQPCSASNAGFPSGVIELCSYYYECVYRVTEFSWRSVKQQCAENMLFSYDAEKCVPEPKNICRVY